MHPAFVFAYEAMFVPSVCFLDWFDVLEVQVSDFYRRPNSELSPAKATLEEIANLSENRGVQLLGQIRNGSCRPRAILFKVLADAVGLESKLMVVIFLILLSIGVNCSRFSSSF